LPTVTFPGAGAMFEVDPYSDGRLRSSGALLKHVSERFANSRWGDRAALENLIACDNDPDRFRSVIADGKRFLASRPQSRYRPDFTIAVAQAFETWWSLSQAVDDEVVKAEDYVAGADEARHQAIDWYEKVVDLAPGSDTAFDAGHRIARLSLKLDTGQRLFSCPYP
jgi:hypothetical protein